MVITDLIEAVGWFAKAVGDKREKACDLGGRRAVSTCLLVSIFVN